LAGNPTLPFGQVLKKPIVGFTISVSLAKEVRQV